MAGLVVLLGDNSHRAWVKKESFAEPTAVGAVFATQVAVGAGVTLVLGPDKLLAVGANTLGQLGRGHIDDDTDDYQIPRAVSDLERLKHIATGYGHCAAVTEDGHLFMWGGNSTGQCGTGLAQQVVNVATRCNSGALADADVQVAFVACGGLHTVALTSDGGVIAFGHNGRGQLGTGNNDLQPTPVRLASAALAGVRIVGCAAGAFFTQLVSDDGLVFATGQNDHGQLGTGNTTDVNTPTVIDFGGAPVAAVACGSDHTMAITRGAGKLYCWGEGGYGATGLGHMDDATAPNACMEEGARVVRVAAGYTHSCALAEDGHVFAFGSCKGIPPKFVPQLLQEGALAGDITVRALSTGCSATHMAFITGTPPPEPGFDGSWRSTKADFEDREKKRKVLTDEIAKIRKYAAVSAAVSKQIVKLVEESNYRMPWASRAKWLEQNITDDRTAMNEYFELAFSNVVPEEQASADPRRAVVAAAVAAAKKKQAAAAAAQEEQERIARENGDEMIREEAEKAEKAEKAKQKAQQKAQNKTQMAADLKRQLQLLERSNPPLAAAPAPSAQAPDELAEARAWIAKLEAANARLHQNLDESQEKVGKFMDEAGQERLDHRMTKESTKTKVSKLENKVYALKDELRTLQAPSGVQAASDPTKLEVELVQRARNLAALGDALIKRAQELSGTRIGTTTDAWGIPQLYLNVTNIPQWNNPGISDRFHMSLHMAGLPNSWHFADHDRSGQLATYDSDSPPAVWHFSTTTAPDYKVAGLDYTVEHSKLLNVLDGIETKDNAVYTQDRSVKLRMTAPELQAMLALLTTGPGDLVELAVTAGIRLQPARVPLVF